MEFKPPKLTKQMNIGVFVALAASFLLYFLGFYVKSRSVVAQLNRSIASEKADLERNKALYAALSNRKPALVDSAGPREIYEKYEQSNASLANVVDALARGDGKSPFSVNRIATEKQESLHGYTKTLFSIDVDASFPAIGGFLEGLEQSPLLTDIQTVDITRISSELQKCSAKIKLQSYVVKR